MASSKIARAVILAAGTGSRLSGGYNVAAGAEPVCPKPLRPVLGKPLLLRVLTTLASAGVREAVIVVGFQGERLKRELGALVRQAGLGIELQFVDNPRFLDKNGVSLLAASEYVDRECLLSMADHLYSKKLVRRLARAELPAGACGLGVDYDIPRCFDLDDATKVRVERGRIVDIAKDLPAYDALDTGVFRIGPALIDELSRVHDRQGDCSLSDGVKALCQRGDFFACNVGNARWIDVDTPAASLEAQRLLRTHGDDLSGVSWLPQPGVVPGDGLAGRLGSLWQRVVGSAGSRRRPVPAAE